MKVIHFTTDNREQQKDYDSPQPHFGTAPEALLEGFALLPDVEVHVISCVRQEVAISPPLYKKIRYHAVRVPKSGWLSSGYLGCIRATRRTVREIGADIVHGQGTERECAMNAVFSGLPNVITIHGNMAELNRMGETFHNTPLYGHLVSLLETFSLGRTGGVFCNSAYTESLVSSRAKRTWPVPNAIRSAFFRPQDNSVSNEVPLILNVGLVSPRKRQLELLRSLRDVWKAGHRFRIVFVGGLSNTSEYEAAFTEELRRAERDGYAEYAGYLSVDGLIKLMDRSHAMIHFPSEESFGLVVAEALARGLKFFGSDVGGIKEIAAGIAAAELHSDLTNLNRRFVAWLNAGAPRQPDSARQIAERYHPQVIAARHIEIYQEVLSRQG